MTQLLFITAMFGVVVLATLLSAYLIALKGFGREGRTIGSDDAILEPERPRISDYLTYESPLVGKSYEAAIVSAQEQGLITQDEAEMLRDSKKDLG